MLEPQKLKTAEKFKIVSFVFIWWRSLFTQMSGKKYTVINQFLRLFGQTR